MKTKSQTKRIKAQKPLPKTMICLVLDRSGSMGGREKDVIGGINTFLAEQKKLPDPATIAMVRFDTSGIERFRPMQDLKGTTDLTADEYKPAGGTPLLDAIGQTITQLDTDWKEVKPDRCIMVIVTDGEENASSEYTKEKIKSMIKAREDSGKWGFIYLGANVDAFAESRGMGFSASNTAGYVNTTLGTSSMYRSMSANVSAKRATGSMTANFAGDAALGGNIGEDGTVKPFGPTAVTPTPFTQPTTTNGTTTTTTTWTPPV